MGRIVALDFGRARVGVAISDERKIIAQPVTCLQNTKKFAEELKKCLTSYSNIECILIGLPLQMNGKEGIMAQEVRAFAAGLEKELPFPIQLWDERLTTAQVERSLREAEVSRKKRSQLVDTLSATLILQNYLDSLIT